ncbi:MAG TPA: ATP-binding protein [Thermomicrobiales bacterium]|jgi:predicted kinase
MTVTSGTGPDPTIQGVTSRPAKKTPAQPEAIIFTGLQGAGKSTFYRERFFATHLRLNLDMLRTRRRERLLLEACLAGPTSFVADNTNPTIEERARFIAPARAAGFRIVGYYFDTPIAVCLKRNAARPAAERVPPIGLYGTRKRLRLPTPEEGFDALYRVQIADEGTLLVEDWVLAVGTQRLDQPNP